LRLVAQQRTGQGSRSAGLDELHAFLTEAGIEPEQYALFDGSGLSRMNEVTPHAVVTLLRFMANSQAKEDWSSLLAIGGVDGTLEKRMTARKVKARVIAKTGSLSHVSALSGYIERRHGNRFAFSILVNNYNGPSSDIRDLIDKICSLLVD
jgi:D-alanyl-D-alanine carboxypeptidase/D-alanyl-D-alanine-endopeptidase (penicillin-binding protein 4)